MYFGSVTGVVRAAAIIRKTEPVPFLRPLGSHLENFGRSVSRPTATLVTRACVSFHFVPVFFCFAFLFIFRFLFVSTKQSKNQKKHTKNRKTSKTRKQIKEKKRGLHALASQASDLFCGCTTEHRRQEPSVQVVKYQQQGVPLPRAAAITSAASSAQQSGRSPRTTQCPHRAGVEIERYGTSPPGCQGCDAILTRRITAQHAERDNRDAKKMRGLREGSKRLRTARDQVRIQMMSEMESDPEQCKRMM